MARKPKIVIVEQSTEDRAWARAKAAMEQFDVEKFGIHPVPIGPNVYMFSVDGHVPLFATIDGALSTQGFYLHFDHPGSKAFVEPF